MEHEVTVVESGYRVTLTYNLYFTEPTHSNTLISPAMTPAEIALKDSLSTLLLDDEFLPDGGRLGFGLSFQYPIKGDLGSVNGCLKGSDAVIKRVCTDLALNASLKIMYSDNNQYRGTTVVMVDNIVDLSDMGAVEDDVPGLIQRYYKGVVVVDQDREYGVTEEIHWVTPMTTQTSVKSEFVAYGNQAEMGYLYGNVCLIVDVGKPGQRETL